jgi:hypothetical protein
LSGRYVIEPLLQRCLMVFCFEELDQGVVSDCLAAKENGGRLRYGERAALNRIRCIGERQREFVTEVWAGEDERRGVAELLP